MAYPTYISTERIQKLKDHFVISTINHEHEIMK
jgi:hypothetical protein